MTNQKEALEDNIVRFSKSTTQSARTSDKIFLDLVKVLITLASLIFSLASPLFFDIDKVKLDFIDKGLLLIIWSSLAISIFFGIFQIAVEFLFFEKVTDFMKSVRDDLEKMRRKGSTSYKKIEKKMEEHGSTTSSRIPMYFQLISFLIAILSLYVLFLKRIGFTITGIF